MKVYLIYSDSYKKIDEEIKKIISNSLNIIKYDLRVDSLSDAINEANYYSLVNEEKFIIVKSNTLFKNNNKDSDDESKSSSDDVKILEKYLENPSTINTIIFTSYEAPDKRRKIYKAIEKEGKVIGLPALNKKELVYECMNLLKAKGYNADYETANYIVENSYVNYDIMTNELNKIYTLVKNSYLNIELIKDVVSCAITSGVYGYINAIINHNLEGTIKPIKSFEILKIDPTVVLISLFKEIEIIYLMKLGTSDKEIMDYFSKEPWQMNSYHNNINKYSLEELKKIITTLCSYDYQIKSGLLDKSVALDIISLELCE